jgi:hypothetical protein
MSEVVKGFQNSHNIYLNNNNNNNNNNVKLQVVVVVVHPRTGHEDSEGE